MVNDQSQPRMDPGVNRGVVGPGRTLWQRGNLQGSRIVYQGPLSYCNVGDLEAEMEHG